MPLQDLSVGSTSSSSNTSGLGSRQSEPTPERTSWWDNFTSVFNGSGGDSSNMSNPEDPSDSLPVVDFGDDDSSADIYDEPEFTYEPEVYAAITDAGTANVFYTPDDILQEAYDADMAGKGEDKPDPLGNMGVPPATLEDVTGTDAGALSNLDPLYKLADDIANPTITTTPLDQEAALRDALMQGQPSGLMSRPSSFTGEGVQVAQANIPNWMTDMSASELTDVLVGIREGTHDAETGERIEDVSPAAEAGDQQSVAISRNGPDVPPEIDTVPPVEQTATDTTNNFANLIINGNTEAISSATHLTTVFNDFKDVEGDTAHVDGRGYFTMPFGVVPDKNSVKKADGTAFDPKGTHGFTNSTAGTVDTSNATHTLKVGSKSYKVKRSDYDSDEAFAKGVLSLYNREAAKSYGSGFDSLSDKAKEMALDIAWNGGVGAVGWTSVKAALKEAGKEKPKTDTLFKFTTNFRSGTEEGSTLKNYPRGVFKRRLFQYNKIANPADVAATYTTTAVMSGGKRTGTTYTANRSDGTVIGSWTKPDLNEELEANVAVN
jgi:hypothetical protein